MSQRGAEGNTTLRGRALSAWLGLCVVGLSMTWLPTSIETTTTQGVALGVFAHAPTARLVRRDASACWGSTFATARTSSADQFVAKLP